MDAALIGLFGILIGSFIQFFFNKNLEKSKLENQKKNEVYFNLINSIAQVATSPDNNAITKLTEAKSQLLVYGDKRVIDAFANFMEKYGRINSPEAFTSYNFLLKEIRKSNNQETVSIESSSILLYGEKVQ